MLKNALIVIAMFAVGAIPPSVAYQKKVNARKVKPIRKVMPMNFTCGPTATWAENSHDITTSTVTSTANIDCGTMYKNSSCQGPWYMTVELYYYNSTISTYEIDNIECADIPDITCGQATQKTVTCNYDATPGVMVMTKSFVYQGNCGDGQISDYLTVDIEYWTNPENPPAN